jgi:hypothetical protein
MRPGARLGFYLVDLGVRGARRHGGGEGEGIQFRLKWAAEGKGNTHSSLENRGPEGARGNTLLSIVVTLPLY